MKQTVYENIVSEAVVSTIKDTPKNNTIIQESIINEALGGGGVWGILLFFLALFGISSNGMDLSSLFSSPTNGNQTTQDQQQQSTQQTQDQQQQTQPEQQLTSQQVNDKNLEDLAKELKLVDIMVKFNGENIQNKPQYATKLKEYGNQVFYSKPPKAYLSSKAAECVGIVLKTLKKQGLGLVVLDATRPLSVQSELIAAAKSADAASGKKYDSSFLANPKKGSPHNSGRAIDCTLYDIKTGQILDMGGPFDERSERSYTEHYKNSKNKQEQEYHRRRMILYNAMDGANMHNYRKEWWHYQI